MTERLGLVVIAVVVLAAMGMAVATDPGTDGDGSTTAEATPSRAEVDPATPSPSPTPSPPAPPPGEPAGWVVAGPDGTSLWTEVDGVVDEVAAPGLTWPIVEEQGDGYVVDTHCDRPAWVAADDVVRPSVARAGDVDGAVVVVDAGHGGIDQGAIGPDGPNEKDVNLAVAARLRDLLVRANDVDPDSGAVSPGDDWPAVAAVLMTRDPDDGSGGDQETSLGFRGRLASGADADALVSIHHNAGETETFDEPPVEALFSVDDAESGRLAGLVVEELRRSLAPLAERWDGTTRRGTIGRADPDGTDFYTVLEEARLPAVITEGLYISTPDGADLARTDAFQQAYAEGLYRALVRFLGTDETGADVNEPVTFDPGESAPRDYSTCSMAAPDASPTPSTSEG